MHMIHDTRYMMYMIVIISNMLPDHIPVESAARGAGPVTMDGGLQADVATSAQHRCDGGPLFGEPDVSRTVLDAAASTLRELLLLHGYTADVAIQRSCTTAAAGGPPGGDEFFGQRHESRLAPLVQDAQGALILLYLTGRAVHVQSVEAALGAEAVAQLLTLGLLVHDADESGSSSRMVLSPVQVYPLALATAEESQRTVFVCTDWDVASALDRRFTVMPIGIDSLQLAIGLPPASTAGRAVLDVCCGSGIQAIVAAAHGAADVLATDVSERAVRFTSFNAALNALGRVLRTAVGGCFEPARGERFDVVLANPPFVAVPHAEIVRPALYVSGGVDGADVVRELVRGAAAAGEGGVLRAGGCLLLVAQLPNIETAHEWLSLAAEPTASERPSDLPAGGETATGGPLPQLQPHLTVVYDPQHTQSADCYAAAHAADAGCSGRAWARALRAAGVGSMGFGIVIVTQSRGCADSSPSRPTARRVLVPRLAGAGASTATMLHGPGLALLRGCIELMQEQQQEEQDAGQSTGTSVAAGRPDLGPLRSVGSKLEALLARGGGRGESAGGFTYQVGTRGVLRRESASRERPGLHDLDAHMMRHQQ